MHRQGAEDAVKDLLPKLSAVEGVWGAELNAVLGRVVVSHDPEVVSGAGVARVVAEVERAWELDRHAQAAVSAAHPANAAPHVRELIAIATQLVGLGYAVVGKALPVRAVSPVASALVSLVDSSPWMRAEVESKLGRPATDAVLAIGGAVGQALAQRPIGLIIDLGYRFCLNREINARRQAWQRWERGTADRLSAHRAEPLECPPRARPLPRGPVEQVANTASVLALAGSGSVLALARNSRRASAMLLAGTPRAAKVGRDGFAAQLDVDLSKAGSLVFEPAALRRLDRVDTVLLDTAMLVSGRHLVDDDVVVIDKAVDPAEILLRAHDLVDPGRPRARSERAGWAVVPASQVGIPLPGYSRRAARDAIAVLRDGRPVGVVHVVVETAPLAEAIVEAARHAGKLILAGDGHRLAARLRVDHVLPGGRHLADTVRNLQADGHVVAVVSPRRRDALAGADVGIGVLGDAGAVPWGAHVVCPDLARACVVLESVPVARQVSRHSATMAVAGSSVGALLGALGPAHSAPLRATFPVQLAALFALGVGTWSGTAPGRRPVLMPVDRTPWHALSRRGVLARLASTRDGLDETEHQRRKRADHVKDQPAEAGLVRASMEELASPFTPALATGAGVSASLGSIVDAAMIFGVLGLNAVIGGAQRLGADRELRRLVETSALRVRVRRGGIERVERADDLVPGDVVELHAGDAVPADCRVLEATGLEVDESSLTGESQLVIKTARATAARAIADRLSMLYQNTVIAAGRAVGVVVATGERTEIGRTIRTVGEPAAETGVAARLRTLTRITLPVTVGAGTVLMISDLMRGRGISQALGRAVGLSVAAVPEGLTFVATVAELASARRLSRRGVLARNPSTIEALGRVDVLCFDKTGTLTEGRITLRLVSDGHHERISSDLTPSLRETLAIGVRASPWHERDQPLPHLTDRAVLDAAATLGVAPDDAVGGLERVDELRFEPSRGYHAVLARTPHSMLVSVKGAPEAVLARCGRWRRPGGPTLFDTGSRRDVDAAIDRLARNGYRVLAVAERTVSDWAKLDDSDIDGLDFCGLLALADPIRPTAADAVNALRRAGVGIVMITGDHPSTAEAIAAELGVLNGRPMTGAELDALNDDELADRLPGTSVFARVSPAQKARIVRCFRRADRVVAMTGDGANDVPAIHLAHVGIALGSQATPAARQAADLVVTDDRIETITDAILEGRAMWTSVRDAVSILLGGNLGEIAFTLAAGLFSARDALNARQLLLINLLTDVLPAMAVAVRPPPRVTPEALLAEGPEASLGTTLNRDIATRAVTTSVAALIAWLLARPVSTPAQAGTTGLVALVGAQLGQTIAVRGRTPLVVAAGVISLALLAGIVQVPGLSRFFGCRPLLPHQWGIALAAATAATAAEILGRAWSFPSVHQTINTNPTTVGPE